MNDRGEVDLAALDVGHLALFVGMAVNQQVLDELTRQGFPALRNAHGFVVQHLLSGPRSVGELAKLLGVTQQAVSKTIKEMSTEDYVEDVASGDARVRMVQLSARGREVVAASRTVRKKLQNKLKRHCGEAELARASKVLQAALAVLGGADAVRQRRVRPVL